MRRAIVLGLIALGGAVACEKVIGADFDDVAPIGAAKADSGAAADAAACDLVHPPDPPALTNSGGTAELYVIARDLKFGEETTAKGTKPPDFGYDLDGLCSNHGDEPPCLPPANTKGDPTDGPRGQDNATCHLVGDQWASLGQANPPMTTATATNGVKTGKFAPVVLLHVKDWYAVYDDEQITVEWLVPLAAQLDPGGAFTPKFDGTDTWPVMAKNAGSSEPLRYVDSKAYMSGGVLVAHFPEVLIPLTTAYFQLKNVVLTGQLALADNKWNLVEGMIAGVVSADHMLHQMPKFTQALLGFPLCANGSTYTQQIKPWICGSAEALFPGTAAGSRCDGLSVGVGFDGIQVAVGTVVTPPADPAFCPPEADTANDTCADGADGS